MTTHNHSRADDSASIKRTVEELNILPDVNQIISGVRREVIGVQCFDHISARVSITGNDISIKLWKKDEESSYGNFNSRAMIAKNFSNKISAPFS